MNLADWSFVVGMTGLGVSALGWGTSIWQIRRVRTASEAVTKALKTERRRAVAATLVAEAAELTSAELTLYREAGKKSADQRLRVGNAVRLCRDQAVRVQQLLESSNVVGQEELATTLTEFLGLVEVCLSDLLDTAVPVPDACERIVQKLSRATGLCRGLQTAIITQGSEE